MRTVQKEKIYGYVFKAILSLILLYCLYNVGWSLFLSPYSAGKLRSKVSRAVNAVESNIRHADPKKEDSVEYELDLLNKINGSSWANQIKRRTVFAGPTKVIVKKAEEEEIVQSEEIEVVDKIEIIFKGMVDNLAYIEVKKEIDGQWREHGFPIKAGERIGGKKIIGGKVLDFATGYVLQDIVHNAQRQMTLMRKVLILNEKGEFVGSRIVPGETYMKSSPQIKYKDENGIIMELWLGEGREKAGEEREKVWYKKILDKTKTTQKKATNNITPTVLKVNTTIENITKDQQEIVNKAKKPFEKNVELLRSILEETESGD